MARSKRASRSSEAEIKKNRIDFLKLDCRAGNHQWASSTADGWHVCTICKAVERNQVVTNPPDKPKQAVKTDVQQASLWE